MLLNVPADDSNQLVSIIDLVNLQEIIFDDTGKNVELLDFREMTSQVKDRAMEYRTGLIESLADYDEQIEEFYLDGTQVDEIPHHLIDMAVFKAINFE